MKGRESMNIVNMPIGDLVPYENNTKIHPPEQVDHIVNSIKRFGWQQPIVVDRNNVVIIGHGRLLAAKQMGLQEVPVVHADELSEEDAQALRLADNKLNESPWDFGKLEQELAELEIAGIDMTQFGFDDIDDVGEQSVVEDEAPEPPKEPISKVGDIYQLRRHRLMCGDSTDSAAVDRLMDGVKADMVFTDSPYGVNIVNEKGKVGADNLAKNGVYAPVIGDDTTDTAQQAYDIYSQLCDKMILWGGNYFLDFLPSSDGWLIWDKRGESGIRNNFADGEMAWCSFHTPVRIYHQLWNGMIREGEHEKRVHPTQKPIRMLSEILQDFTNEGDIILDVFGGSGSTLIACEQMNRTCYMMELDPHYVDVIIERWQNLTGEKAVLLNG